MFGVRVQTHAQSALVHISTTLAGGESGRRQVRDLLAYIVECHPYSVIWGRGLHLEFMATPVTVVTKLPRFVRWLLIANVHMLLYDVLCITFYDIFRGDRSRELQTD